MSIQTFAFGRQSDAAIRLPLEYRQRTSWSPRIGDVFPDFSANTTVGRINFQEWAKGSWVYLFSHPSAFTPVCTTEIADVARHASDFAERGVKCISISRNTTAEQRLWAKDVRGLFHAYVDFPQVSDPDGVITAACDMLTQNEAGAVSVRKSFILDPNRRIRLMLEYPVNLGRSVTEVLRVIDGLQICEKLDAAAPSSWEPGKPLLVRHDMPEAQVRRRFGDSWNQLTEYLRVLQRPPSVLRDKFRSGRNGGSTTGASSEHPDKLGVA
jgi:thioredoxin-dependent peroxiredoxin